MATVFMLAFLVVGAIAKQEKAFLQEKNAADYFAKLNQDTLRFQSGVIHSDSTPEGVHEAFIEALKDGDIEKAVELIEAETREEKKGRLYEMQTAGELPSLIVRLSRMTLRYKDNAIASYEIREGIEGHVEGYEGPYVILTRDKNGEWKTEGF